MALPSTEILPQVTWPASSWLEASLVFTFFKVWGGGLESDGSGVRNIHLFICAWVICLHRYPEGGVRSHYRCWELNLGPLRTVSALNLWAMCLQPPTLAVFFFFFFFFAKDMSSIPGIHMAMINSCLGIWRPLLTLDGTACVWHHTHMQAKCLYT